MQRISTIFTVEMLDFLEAILGLYAYSREK